MGTFTFKWPHDAQVVYVTGTFDNWSKSEELVKVGDSWEKTVTLPDASGKIYYKVSPCFSVCVCFSLCLVCQCVCLGHSHRPHCLVGSTNNARDHTSQTRRNAQTHLSVAETSRMRNQCAAHATPSHSSGAAPFCSGFLCLRHRMRWDGMGKPGSSEEASEALVVVSPPRGRPRGSRAAWEPRSPDGALSPAAGRKRANPNPRGAPRSPSVIHCFPQMRRRQTQ
ncbi:hypothetical protein B0T17DRAFT_376149 [Bombardia bombarda]|uniref:AMP-activated protein kinase glycogen-binding domain-containing protein n=1 Tax=Bombardia bombarda TaxID=252184 RepID=A0AA39WGN6_9PEZI|nr:hypothetical protein B0T17DRAFT_376149 [Bombardia bombarda]